MIARKEKRRLGDLLVEAGVLSNDKLSEALELQHESKELLGIILVKNNFVSEDDIITAMQNQLHIQRVALDDIVIGENIINRYNDVTSMKQNVFVPFKLENGVLYIAMSDPMNTMVIDDVSTVCGCKVVPCVAKQSEIAASIDRYYGSEQVRSILNEINESEYKPVETVEATEDISDDNPIVRLVTSFFEQAVHLRASDIHIEPLKSHVRVRYRVDGDLVDSGTQYGSNYLHAIITRIKVLGGMNIAERRRPQDGRITQIIDGVEYDVRVSILPSVYGEKIVMRITNKDNLTMQKKDLGLFPDDEQKLDDLLSNSHGILLVTGPTGSGKSTTLYTALSELNRIEVNITTIEDPVEANIDGLTQVQINEKAGLTFPIALRTFLRQDPDIIMVGEIRDVETANLAIDAALTGHLVVSTLHTNNSVSSISRLQKMGIESYLLADALVGVVAQRLVKRLCVCKKEHKATRIEKIKLGVDKDKDLTIYEPCGCVKCNNTGYLGRIGVYEIFTITDVIRNMIIDEKPVNEIETAATAEGLVTLRKSAARLIIDGVTTVAEMDRIVHDSSIFAEEEIE